MNERPKREDFIFIIPCERYSLYPTTQHMVGELAKDENHKCFRNKPLSELGWDLNQYIARKMENTYNCWRLYHYGQQARGVFTDEVVVQVNDRLPLPSYDEKNHFAGLMFYNQEEYEEAMQWWLKKHSARVNEIAQLEQKFLRTIARDSRTFIGIFTKPS